MPCAPFEAIIPLKTCLMRQAARWPGRGRAAAIYRYCGSGECAQGAGYAARTSYSAMTDWASKSKAGKASYQFFRKDTAVQRRKRRLLALSQPLGEVPSIDGVRPAAEGAAGDDVGEVLRVAAGP